MEPNSINTITIPITLSRFRIPIINIPITRGITMPLYTTITYYHYTILYHYIIHGGIPWYSHFLSWPSPFLGFAGPLFMASLVANLARFDSWIASRRSHTMDLWQISCGHSVWSMEQGLGNGSYTFMTIL